MLYRKLTHGAAAALCLLLVTACSRTTPTEFTAQMPFKLETARFGEAVANDGDIIYVFGGSHGGKWLNDVEIIDPETQNIQVLHDHIIPRRYFSAVYDGEGKIYLIGGISHQNDTYTYESRVEVFDTQSRTITEVAPLPYPTRMNAAVYLNGKIYVLGGGHRDWQTGDMTQSSLMAVYDTTSNSWSLAPPMPTARETTAIAYEGQIYTVGGYDGKGASTVVERFDPATNQWETLAPLPRPLSAHSTTVWQDQLFTFGHYTDLSASFVLDFDSQTWTPATLPLKAGRHHQATTLGNKVYVIGGSTPDQAGLDLIQVFDAATLSQAAE